MQYRSLGSSGLQVSVAGLGCNNFGMRIDEDASGKVVHEALEQGINFFDTADSYGETHSEEWLGRALQGHRQEAIIATKFASPMGEGPNRQGGSREYIFNAVHDSLRRLGTDYIDVYQMHRPDPHTPIDETLGALDDLVRQGTVRYLGSSNFSGWEIAHADWTARTQNCNRFVCAQNEWNLLRRAVEQEVIPACGKFTVGMLPFFPLASGLLTGKYIRGEDPAEGTRMAAFPGASRALSDRNFDRLDALAGFAQERGKTLLDLALSWLASQPSVSSVIAGATSPEQVRSNVAATQALSLNADDVAEIDKRLKAIR